MQAHSQARNNALPDRTNMPKLPLEVIQNIFAVSLPPRSHYDRSRLAFLLPLCLVHRSLTRYIQRILFANIVLRGMEPTRRFLESLDLVPEFRRWVKTLKLDLYDGARRRGGEADDTLATIVKYCIEMKEVELFWVESVNSALFAQLKHLRSLKCCWLHLAYFEPIVGQSTTFGSLVSLSFVGGSYTDMNRSFLVPEILPSLRRLCVDDDGDEGPFDNITALYDIASQLRHLLFERWSQVLGPLLDKCTKLLSLAVTVYDTVLSHRLSKPLIGFRLFSNPEDEDSSMVEELLEEALSSGLISASADTRTVIFLSQVDEDRAREYRLPQWAESLGLELNYSDGALEREWRSDRLDGGYSEFTQWVDKEAARREAALEARKMKR